MSQRILVVEDQEDNRRILRDLLTKAGFELVEATTGEDGVRLHNHPDLILMMCRCRCSTATKRPSGSKHETEAFRLSWSPRMR
jgi:response regulator RpfG family c-di-GMP phosphodiesterase